MKKRKTYSGSFKAAVVREFINSSVTLEELAKKYRVHPNQIKNWKSLLLKEAPRVFDDRRRKAKSKSRHTS